MDIPELVDRDLAADQNAMLELAMDIINNIFPIRNPAVNPYAAIRDDVNKLQAAWDYSREFR